MLGRRARSRQPANLPSVADGSEWCGAGKLRFGVESGAIGADGAGAVVDVDQCRVGSS